MERIYRKHEPYTNERIDSYLTEKWGNAIERIGEVVNAHTPVLLRRIIDNYTWAELPVRILRGSKCPLIHNPTRCADLQAEFVSYGYPPESDFEAVYQAEVVSAGKKPSGVAFPLKCRLCGGYTKKTLGDARKGYGCGCQLDKYNHAQKTSCTDLRAMFLFSGCEPEMDFDETYEKHVVTKNMPPSKVAFPVKCQLCGARTWRSIIRAQRGDGCGCKKEQGYAIVRADCGQIKAEYTSLGLTHNTFAPPELYGILDFYQTTAIRIVGAINSCFI